MIQAVVFDFDDTLVKTRLIKWAQHKAIAREYYGNDLTDDDILKHWGKPLNVLITELHRAADTIENMLSNYRATNHRFQKVAEEGARETTLVLLAGGLEVGVVTAANREFVLSDLKRLGFPTESFFHIQAADETEFHKPDPRVFDPTLEALHDIGIEVGKAVYVGDALWDYVAARDAGMDFIGVTTGLASKAEFKKTGAPQIIDRIDKLPALLLRQ